MCFPLFHLNLLAFPIPSAGIIRHAYQNSKGPTVFKTCLNAIIESCEWVGVDFIHRPYVPLRQGRLVVVERKSISDEKGKKKETKNECELCTLPRAACVHLQTASPCGHSAHTKIKETEFAPETRYFIMQTVYSKFIFVKRKF